MHSHSLKYSLMSQSLSQMASTCTGVPSNFLFACRIFYWSFTLTLILIILPWNSHLHSDDLCFKCLWFIYHFYRVYIFHSLRTQIHARITDPVTLIHTNDEWIVMTFTRNYINKSWSDHAWLIIQGLKHNNQWSNNDLPFFILASKHFFCWFVELGLISKTVISGFFFNLCLWRLYSKNPWWLD